MFGRVKLQEEGLKLLFPHFSIYSYSKIKKVLQSITVRDGKNPLKKFLRKEKS
jgi:hypothetical protein